MRDGIGVSLPYKQERGHERKEREKKKAERRRSVPVRWCIGELGFGSDEENQESVRDRL